MAYSFVYYTGDGATTDFTYNLGYISTSHVSVTINGVATTAYTWFSSTVIRFTTAPASAAVIYISRSTSPGTRLVTYETGTTMTKVILETDSKQAFYMMQEALDGQSLFMTQDTADAKWNANSKVIKNGATPVATTDLTTKAYVDSEIDNKVTEIGAGTVNGPATTVSGNVVLWNNTNGTAISDAGFSLTDHITGTGTLTANNLVKANANRVVEDSGVAVGNVVTAATSATSTNQILLTDTAAKSVKYLEDGPDSTFLSTSGGVPYWTTISTPPLVYLGSSSAIANLIDFTIVSETYVGYRIIGSGISLPSSSTFQPILWTGSAALGAFSGTLALNGNYMENATISGFQMFTHDIQGKNGQYWLSFLQQTYGGTGTATIREPLLRSNVVLSGATTIRYSYTVAPTAGLIHIYGVKAA